MSDCSENFT